MSAAATRSLVMAVVTTIATMAIIGGGGVANPAWARPSGGTWDEATQAPEAEANELAYQRALEDGDTLVIQAASSEVPFDLRVTRAEQAIEAYTRASIVRPDAAEPMYRVAATVFTFFVECVDQFEAYAKRCEPQRLADNLEQVVIAWHRFETLAPSDPRLNSHILFERAIMHTKLIASRPQESDLHLAAGARDYETIIARAHRADAVVQTVVSNLAETYMMLGRLDEAITTYRRSLLGGSAGAAYGLAVALDRDEQGRQARELIRAQGAKDFVDFQLSVQRGATFFVPHGEVYYYLALIEESLGDPSAAIRDYRRFLATGAHPRYQARARANIDALVGTRTRSR